MSSGAARSASWPVSAGSWALAGAAGDLGCGSPGTGVFAFMASPPGVGIRHDVATIDGDDGAGLRHRGRCYGIAASAFAKKSGPPKLPDFSASARAGSPSVTVPGTPGSIWAPIRGTELGRAHV